MKNIDQDIKNNQYKSVYLLYGDEDYNKIRYRNLLRNAIVGDDTMNYSYFEGKDISIGEIRDTAVTMPFFAERRLIIIENSGYFSKAADELVELVKKLPDTTIMVFVEGEKVDKRLSLYKTILKTGYACEMNIPTASELRTFAGRILKKYGKNITNEDADYFIARTGSDMYTVGNEASKLASYVGDRPTVTRQDIEAVCIVPMEDHVFDMIAAINEHNVDKAMKLYGEMLALKEPPLKTLVLLGRQCARLLLLYDMRQSGVDNKTIAQRAGINPYYVGREIEQALKFKRSELEEMIEDCVNADTDIKSGIIEDKYALELLIVKFATKGQR